MPTDESSSKKSIRGRQNLWLPRIERIRNHPVSIVLMAALCLLILAATALRIQRNYSTPSREFDWSNRGFSDFHNGTYFPTRAFIDGKSPYSPSVANEYNMSRATPPYSPVVFLLHLPVALLALEWARVLFFLLNFLLLAGIARLTMAACCQPFHWFDFLAITNLLLVSRPGHITMFTGYFTAEIVLGCLVAIHYARSRPAISGVGMVLASIKPNFVIPLILLMTLRRNFRAVTLGILFSAVTAATGLGWLTLNSSVEQTIADIRSGQDELHVDETEMPVNTWTRVDLLGMLAKIVGWVPGDGIYVLFMLLLISAFGVYLWRWSQTESNHGASGVTGSISILLLLLSIYHHSYDCLLLILPLLAASIYGQWNLPEIHPNYRWLASALLIVPLLNYVSTKSIMEKLVLEPLSFAWQSVTLINGFCILASLLIFVFSFHQIDSDQSGEIKDDLY